VKPCTFLLGVALGIAGCSGDVEHCPAGTPIMPGPGGGGTTTTPRPDAPTVAADAGGATIAGRLCAATGIIPTACTPRTDAAGLGVTVRETGATTTAGSDGTFTLAGAPGLVRVTLLTPTTSPIFFGSVVTVALDAGGGAVASVPVLRQDDATALAAVNIGALPSGTGILVVHTGVGVTIADGSAAVYYDAGDAPLLTITPPTGTSGVAAIFGVVGAQTLSLTRGTAQAPAQADAFGGAITFLEAPL
jgi:hypothetical protein